MGKFKKFGEFFNKKRKELIDVKDGLAGEDYDGPLSVKPPQTPTKGKTDKPLPYKNPDDEDKNVVMTAPDDGEKKGLAHNATPGIKPETSSLGKPVTNTTKQLPKPKKMTTEEFVAATKNMDDATFMQFVAESHGTQLSTVTDLFGNEFTPDPTQAIQYVAGLMLGNPIYMAKFVRELKRRDGMQSFMSEMFDHNDTYDQIIVHLEDEDRGPERCNRLGRIMNERHMSMLDDFDFGESVGPGVDVLLGNMPQQTPKKQGGAFGGGSGPDGTPDANYSSKGKPQGGAFGGGSGPDGTPDPNYSSKVAGGATAPQFPGQPPVMPPKKMKEGGEPVYKGKKSAAFALINELSGYPAFKKYMSEKCTGPNC